MECSWCKRRTIFLLCFDCDDNSAEVVVVFGTYSAVLPTVLRHLSAPHLPIFFSLAAAVDKGFVVKVSFRMAPRHQEKRNQGRVQPLTPPPSTPYPCTPRKVLGAVTLHNSPPHHLVA